MPRCLVLLLGILCALQALDAPDDPPWGRLISPDASKNEVAVTSRDRLLRDNYGYLAVLPVGASWDTASNDWSGGVDVRMRYIPYRGSNSAGGEVDMPRGVPPGGLYHSGSHTDDYYASYVEGPSQFAVDSDGFSGEGTDRLNGIPRQGMWMCEDEVDQQTWMELWPSCGLGPDHFDHPQFPADDRPVERVTRTACQTWLTQLSASIATGLTAAAASEAPPTCRLPSEREWEYACRASTSSSYWAGPSLTPVDWEIDILPASSSHAYLSPRSHSDLRTIVTKRWNGQSNISDQINYLAKFLNKPKDTWDADLGAWVSGVRDVSAISIPIKVTVKFNDYFLFEPTNIIEANIDSRHRPRYIADCYGRYLAVPKRYRKITDDHYVEDPTIENAACWYRLDNDSLPGADGQTPDEQFIALSSAHLAYRHIGPGIDHWRQHDHGDHLWIESNGNGSVEDHECSKLEIARYAPAIERFRALGANPNPTVPANFVVDPEGDWVDVSFAGQRRFRMAKATYNLGSYDSAGSFWGCTVPGEPIDGFDRSNVERAIADIPLPGIVSAGGGTVSITINAGELSTINNDVAALLAAIKQRYPPGVHKMENEKWRIHDYTTWRVKLNVTVSWSSIDSWRKNDGYDHDGRYAADEWPGFDLGDLTLDYFRPNPWGLFHMSGNVAEWCSDNWDGMSDYANPTSTANQGIVRGGSWRRGAAYARSASREWREAEGEHPNLFKRWDLNGNGSIDANEKDSVDAFSLPGYDDVGFRFVIPE